MGDVFASLDLGGTTISGVLATQSGEVVARARTATGSHEGPAAVMERMAALVESLAAQAEKPRAVGVGVPGLIDLERGVTKFLPNLPTQWPDVPVAETLSRRLERPVALLNDARMAALGELRFGLGKGSRLMVFFTLGTGIGGGIGVDGRLLLGPLGAAGEIGHQTIEPNGPLCGCGSRGCLETLASGPAICGEAVRLMRTGLAPRLHERTGGEASSVTPAEVAAAVREGDGVLGRAVERIAVYLGIGVANLVTTLHPDLVVLGGGVAGMGSLLLDPVRRTVRERVGMFPTEDVRVEISALGDEAGALGGIALAVDRSARE